MHSFTGSKITRRAFALSAVAALAGCASTNADNPSVPTPTKASMKPVKPAGPIGLASEAELQARYAAFEDGGFAVPAVPYKEIDPRFYRQRVTDPTGEPAGTVVVDTPSRLLYLVEPGGTAMRYGVGIGREGFAWGGEGIIHWRQPWPRWKVPDSMIARQPSLAKYSVENGGMEPGLRNPLGARALYIFQDGKDTLYRLHGSPDWKSIGKAASSGCVRLLNQDVVDLYRRVPYHARIVVYQQPMTRQSWA